MTSGQKCESDGVWVEEVDTHSYDVDISARMTIESLLKYFQEAAWNHAEHLGVGYSHLSRRGQVWMLSRMMVVVDSYPAWGQAVVVHTWPCGSKSLLALRDFELLDREGHRLAAATSGWLVFDLHSRRPLRIEPIIESIRSFPDRRSLGYDAPKLTAAETPSPTVLKVRYSDLDLNNHVNNATYARWMLDSYPVEFHRSHQVRSLAINFLAELDGSDSVELSTIETKEHCMTHTVRCMLDGTPACRAEISWQPSH